MYQQLAKLVQDIQREIPAWECLPPFENWRVLGMVHSAKALRILVEDGTLTKQGVGNPQFAAREAQEADCCLRISALHSMPRSQLSDDPPQLA